MNTQKAYPSDLTDEEWQHLRILLPRKGGKGRTPKHNLREMMNAILYVVRTGCQWRALPHEFPPWETVYGYFRKLGKNGTWERINHHLRVGIREQEGREAEPSVVIVDSQSVKTTEKKGCVVSTVASGSKDEKGISQLM